MKGTVIALVGCVGLLLGYVVGQTTGLLPPAHAQSEGSAGRVIAVMASTDQQYTPIVLVDTLEQTLIVYTYNRSGRSLALESARTYQFDKQLYDFRTDGVSVDQIRARIESQ